MRSTNVYIIAFGIGIVAAMTVVFAINSGTALGWILIGLFWLLVFLGVVGVLTRIAPEEPRESKDLGPPHPLIADVIDPKKYRKRRR